ncbi:hypothetical protein DEO72_LG7g431 [Vigna unguiculata]|uniref:TF-B3 domain-containing protein n=1 Tax=Vigna unguiculata TaxID=3917 RepID=A0A4D6MEI8_VIGUN|nr:hypothetical protein DEO72_LG7g431 [Vigna unguiculata]
MVFLQELVPEFTPLGISNMGNYLMVEFEESFMQNRSFRIAREISNFYKLDDLYWLGILYCGHRYFQIRIFSLAMKEIDYPAPRLVPNPQRPLSSSRFFTCFKSELLLPQKKHEVGIHKSVNGDLILQKGELEMAEYFNVKENKIIHKSYVDRNTILFRLFSSEGIEINYAPQVVSVSNHDTHLGDYDPADFYYSMAKCLSENDTKSSSLYLESEFAAKALVKKRTRYILVNSEGDCWPCTIRRSGRMNKECYLSCGWKEFCKQNKLKEGTIIRLGVDKEQSNFIYVMEIKV